MSVLSLLELRFLSSASLSDFEVCFPNFMVMMIQNIAVDQRFANGTQGRLLHWHPTETESKRKALPAYSQDLLVRFCKESALSKTELMPGGCFYWIPQAILYMNVMPSMRMCTKSGST